MILSVHILAGAAIAAKTQNPVLGISMAFLSHYILDTFPQKEYLIKNIRGKLWKKSLPDFLLVFLDIAIGFSFIYFTNGLNFLICLGGLVTIIPDSSTLLFLVFSNNKILEKHFLFHAKINSISKKIPPFWGIISQFLIFGLSLLVLSGIF